jgi:transcription elongation factor GreA
MQKIPITVVGLKRLEDERTKLKNIDRPNIIKAISAARDLGDLSENAEYHAAREQQGFIEGRIEELEYILAKAEVINPTSIKSDKIIFGATVSVQNLDTDKKTTYQIVGEPEANLEIGLISYSSPIGKALISKKVGDIVDVATAKKTTSFEVLKIEYK